MSEIKPLFYFYFEWNNLILGHFNEKISMLTAERDKLNTERNKFRDENEKLNKQLQRIQESEKRLRVENNHLKGDVDRLKGDVESHKVQVRYPCLCAKISLSCGILVVNGHPIQFHEFRLR